MYYYIFMNFCNFLDKIMEKNTCLGKALEMNLTKRKIFNDHISFSRNMEGQFGSHPIN